MNARERRLVKQVLICVSLCLSAMPVHSQIQAGQFKLNMNGVATFGYTGDFGNLNATGNGLSFGGNGTLTGSYYSPSFLNFNIQPFYNQSRTNSSFQSISDSSGVNASTSIFGGSNFPGSVSYNKSFNSQGNFNVPGVADYTSHGDSQVLSVAWNEIVPKLPTVSFSFQDGRNDYSLYGASGDIVSSYRTIGAQSTYSVVGFRLNGGYNYTATQSETPDVFGTSQAAAFDSASGTYSAGIGHSLPFHGSFSAGASRSDISADGENGHYQSTLDTVNGGMTFNPITPFHFGATLQYTDNLAAQLEQAVLPAAAGVVGTPAQGTHSMDAIGFANYNIPALHIVLNGTEDHREQAFLGQNYTSDAITGAITYGNRVMDGFLNATAAVTRNQVSNGNQTMLGLMGTVNYSRAIRGWDVSGTGNYSQNTQTVLIAYTNSGYGYTGTVARRFSRKTHWAASGSGSKSIINNQAGSGSFSQAYSTVLAVKWIGISGAYSRSSGNSVLTASGLTPITVPLPVVTPGSVILYGGRAYSAGIGVTPFSGLTFSASYSRASSDTKGDSLDSSNKTQQFNSFLQYRVRKVYITAGYSRLSQSFSAAGNVPGLIGSYYLGISRWFQFF
jgi:hypothetical protein